MRENRFTFLCNADERRLLASMAEVLQRTQSDVIRFVLKEKANEMGLKLTDARMDSQNLKAIHYG
jgi:hypothetical protein